MVLSVSSCEYATAHIDVVRFVDRIASGTFTFQRVTRHCRKRETYRAWSSHGCRRGRLIVGGGILALAGIAFATTGPSAMLAFALNGLIAMLTALSFGEMASKFPESGGTYAFSRKVLSIEAAFAVGWIVWFASIVAAMLYAIGFGYFSVLLVRESVLTWGNVVPGWLSDPRSVPLIAIIASSRSP